MAAPGKWNINQTIGRKFSRTIHVTQDGGTIDLSEGWTAFWQVRAQAFTDLDEPEADNPILQQASSDDGTIILKSDGSIDIIADDVITVAGTYCHSFVLLKDSTTLPGDILAGMYTALSTSARQEDEV